MKKILLFIAISVLIFSNKIASAEWSMYGETEAGYHFIDLNNTSSDDRYVYYWILTDYKEPQKNNVINDSFLSKKVYKQTDCRRFRTSASEIIIYSKNAVKCMGEHKNTREVIFDQVLPPPMATLASPLVLGRGPR